MRTPLNPGTESVAGCDNSRIEVRCLHASNLNYASFYLAGFAAHRPHGLRLTHHQLSATDPLSSALENYMALLFFELIDAGRTRRFCIDCYDDSSFVHEQALEASDFYFKVNYTPSLAERSSKIMPVHPGFPLRLPLAQMRSIRGPQGLIQSARLSAEVPTAAGFWLRNRTLDWYRALRQTPKRHDIYLVLPFYTYGHDATNELRLHVVEALRKATDITGLVGFYAIGDETLPSAFRRYQVPYTSKVKHLTLRAEARIAPYIRGIDECLSFKFGEQLASGAVVVGHKLPSAAEHLDLPPALRAQYCCDDPAEIVETTRRLLQTPRTRSELAQQNAAFFDQQLVPLRAVGQLLNRMQVGQLANHRQAKDRRPPLAAPRRGVGAWESATITDALAETDGAAG